MVDARAGGDGLIYDEGGLGPCGIDGWVPPSVRVLLEGGLGPMDPTEPQPRRVLGHDQRPAVPV